MVVVAELLEFPEVEVIFDSSLVVVVVVFVAFVLFVALSLLPLPVVALFPLLLVLLLLLLPPGCEEFSISFARSGSEIFAVSQNEMCCVAPR